MKFKKTFFNKKILITGNTGFKGCWLTLWFLRLGANVVGVSKGLPSNPSLFEILNLKKKIKFYKFDITDYKKLSHVIKKEKPDFIFHLAAQALVLRSYKKPLETIKTNVIGTTNVLEVLKFIKKKCVCIIITSDKCYENLELKRGYKETDLLGGKDIYSSSKASAEIITSSYFRTFLIFKKNIRIGVARAGNVIGGGDWAENRIIPDWYRFFSRKKILSIRYPNSTRPWQHVLEPLSGYLTLAMNLALKNELNGQVFNFGPKSSQNENVLSLIKKLNKSSDIFSKNRIKIIKGKLYESGLLKLNCSKAERLLLWKANLKMSQLIQYISEWYICYFSQKKNIFDVSMEQIKNFEKIAKINKIFWSN